ncbi:uncharacterized protein LOC134690385 [Mytilus trossulus]|uniref:uncharacterized protein LOC134690385 n=1 Tax=Mytilus trossulus TaxID=6551 RepID=UPI0030057EF2
MSGEKKKYYHYTSEENGYIKQSTKTGNGRGDDARHGSGVYLTKMPPTERQSDIAKNNYMGGWKKQERLGKVDKAIEIECGSSASDQESDRDIGVYRGDLDIRTRGFKIHDVKKK